MTAGLVLMSVPLIPLWTADVLAVAFGWDQHASEIVGGVFAAMLFVGMAAIGWELLQRHVQDVDELDQ